MSDPGTTLEFALKLHQSGDLHGAAACYLQIPGTDPQYPEALRLLGLVALQQGRGAAAIEFLNESLARRAGHAETLSNLGSALQQMGRLEEAAGHHLRALNLKPDFAEVHLNLGNVYKQQGKLAEAARCYRDALRFRPDLVLAHNNLGNLVREQGDIHAAIDCFRQALRLAPNLALAHNNLGFALKDLGKLDEAIACYLAAIALDPEYAEALNNLGNAWLDLGKLEEAAARIRQAILLRPNQAELHLNLGNVLRRQANLSEAEACYCRAIELRPDLAVAHNNLGNIHKDQGAIEAAVACFQRAVELKPDYAEAHSNLVYSLHFLPGCDATTLAEEHRQWNARHAESLSRSIPAHANDPNPDRHLRIGYVSPDLRAHPVGIFLLPLLESHDRNRFTIVCYANSPQEDDVTHRLRACADLWRNVAGLTDDALAACIRDDRIDILVDLASHLAGNRLLTFARKPAPVQATYLAYCSTTGLRVMDYRLTDPYLDSPAGSARHYTEESIWLPNSYWCYRPLVDVPGPGPLPAVSSGKVTFGCLNNFCKVNELSLAAWRRVLQEVPGGRLLLHANLGAHRGRVQRFFEAGNIDRTRLEFAGHLPFKDYLRLYDRIDIGLDPFPYTGGTTTCDALWMGVPVISLAGETGVSRGGLSILSNAGLPELAVANTEEYVRKAVSLSSDLRWLVELRAGLRDRLKASPLMDVRGFSRGVENAYRQMWNRWCRERG